MTDSRWAVLLCKFSEDNSASLPVSHYKDLFTGQGTGTFNMTDYFSVMSHGQMDLTKSEVFGWFPIAIKNKAEYDSFDAKHAADPTIPGSRNHLIDVGRKTAAAQNIDLSKFAGLVICMNGPMDYFGYVGGMVAVFDSVNGLRPSVMGQEMGHGYGLDHSRRDGSTVDYQDPWDTMSTDTTPYELANANYGSIGPGLNAWNMRSRGWLDEARVWKTGSGNTNVTVDLRPLHRHDLSGTLAIDFLGDYLVEYRKKERWDGGFSHSAVFVHRFESNHSYVMAGTKGNYDLVAGDKFEFGDPNSTNIFSTYGKIEVISIDDATSTAKIGVVHRKPYELPQIYGSLIGGVSRDGGGWIVVNGHLIRIPPWDPLYPVIAQIAVYRQAEAIVDVSVRRDAQQSALQSVRSQISALGSQLNPFRAPGAALGKENR